jgi:hypothetical protein
MGEDTLQRWIVELLRPLVEQWLAQRRVKALVGADQFIYWRQHDPHRRVAPDVYVLPGVAPATHVRAWKVWETGIAPSFCFEVVSRDWEKDDTGAPERYAALGARELVIFDPAWAGRSGGLRWQVYRRLARRGLVRVEATNGDRVRSRVLGCWLRALGVGVATRVRVASGARGETLLPTPAEMVARAQASAEYARAAAQSERAAKEAALARAEAEQTAREAALALAENEREAKEAALARVKQLEARLARRGRPRRRR